MELIRPGIRLCILGAAAALIAAFLPRAALPSTSLAICQIQGSGKTSPYVGQTVTVEGVVTADFDEQSERGFFIQQENCDGNANTSDGLFVYIDQMLDVAAVGDWVQVTGQVEEFYGLTQVKAAPAQLAVLSQNLPLPQPVDFSPPFDNAQANDYFEARESMRVQAADTVVVGPTDARGDTFVVRAELGIARVFQDDPAGTGEVIPVGEDGVYKITPDAQVGDQVFDLLGVLDFSGGEFRLKLTGYPILIRPQTLAVPAVTQAESLFSVATLNLHNLFDSVDDPNTDDSVPAPSAYQTHLKKLALTIHEVLGEPTLIAVQEAENGGVLQALINRPEILSDYAFIWEDGPDWRGIDVALLYQTGQATVLSSEYRQGCTQLVDGLGPDGNQDVQNPSNTPTCDTNGDNVKDGNRLFSRPPLVAHLQVCAGGSGCAGAVWDVWVIAAHFKSKSQDTSSVQYTLPRRIQQAEFVAALYQEILAGDPAAQVFVLGDLNDFPNSQPLAALAAVGLADLTSRVPRDLRYTYIYRGVSQVLDYALASPGLVSLSGVGLFPTIAHVNADFPASLSSDGDTLTRASDHDPVRVEAISLPYAVWLPAVRNP